VKRIGSQEDLQQLREEMRTVRQARKTVVRACVSTGCRSQKSLTVVDALRRELREQGLETDVEIKKTGCHGFCEMGPIIVVEPLNTFYRKVKAEDAPAIVESIANGDPVEGLLWKDPVTGETFSREADLPVYRSQKKWITYRSGRVDPKDIGDYIAENGYSALSKALFSMGPGEVIAAVTASGLRGRGGGGFPTGIKWRLCHEAGGDIKYIVANGDEGDPGAFMDRSLMEGDPFSVIEGMTIAAYAIGASRGFIYVRQEYPIAIEHLSAAITQAEECGLLGSNILGSGFTFTIQINTGAGAFVCGEETALLISLEGRSGTPRSRPPFPATEGLWGRPTVINNVETLANVPLVISRGHEQYRGTGTEGNSGTKVFSVVGKVRNTGLVEVEMGTTLRQIIFDIGGGIRRGRQFKAVQTGGPSGGCIPASRLDMPVDYDSLRQAGAIMGSGGMIVMDETSCMVDVARYFVNFLMYESCGKCTPCREGLKQMHQILEDICCGLGRDGDIETLIELAGFMKEASLCGLGSTAPNPVLSTIRHFRHEYESHIHNRTCRSGVCRNLFEYGVEAGLCTGCGLCRLKCPEHAVGGEKKAPHVIDASRCVKCGICFNACRFNAIVVREPGRRSGQ
jgi:NADH-quinone oxidoreductase subunit F